MVSYRILKQIRSVRSVIHWRRRLIFWCSAIVIGVVSAGFALMSDITQNLFRQITDVNILFSLLLSPLVFAAICFITVRTCPMTRGGGIPQVMAARILDNSKDQAHFIGPRALIGKLILTPLGLLGGASMGREGPTVQIGAAILFLGARYGRLHLSQARNVLLAGAAAGVAAAFNTPLAGIVFAIEEMARSFDQKISGVVMTAIVFAGAASLSLLGNYVYFGEADGNYDILRDFPAILTIGIFGGLLGALFARILTDAGPWLLRNYRTRTKMHPATFAALCGLGVAILGLISGGMSFGSGYVQARTFLQNNTDHALLFTVTKFLATGISSFSGIPGGLFSPSLSVGAGLGAILSAYFPQTPVAGMVILGMAAYLTGVTQSPITAFIIVLEITGRQSMPVPLIAACLIAAGISRVLNPVPLYQRIAQIFIRELQNMKALKQDK